MAVPELDPEQRRAALEKAAHNRAIRAEVKEMLKLGQVSLAEVIERADTAEALAKMRVSEVIAAMPAFGPVKARRLMEQLNIAQSRRLKGLGPRQREALIEVFEQRK